MSVLCLLHGVHEIIFPLWVLAPGLLFHLLFFYLQTPRHVREILARQRGEQESTGCLLLGALVEFLSTACCHFEVCRRKGPSSSLQKVFSRALLLFVPSGLPEGGGGISPLAKMVGLPACRPRACEIPAVVSAGLPLLGPSKGGVLYKIKLKLHRNWAFCLMNNKHQKHKIVQSGYCVSQVS